jgi:hypothetical protein
MTDIRCELCKHWTENAFGYLPEDRDGTCDGLQGDKVQISVVAGWEGGYLDEITTAFDFFCGNFKPK